MAKVWDKDKVTKVAQECKHRSEFQEKWSGAYKYAKKNGLLDILFPELFPNHDEPNLWNYDECKKVSKQYKTVSDLKSKYNGAYKAMLRYGWLDDLYPDRLKHKPHFDYSSLTYDICKDIAGKYETASELMKLDRPIYNFSYKNDWLSSFYSNYVKPHSKWTYDDCKELISQYKSLNDFTNKHSGAYSAVITNKWYDLLTELDRKSKPSGYWTYDRCKETVSKYKTHAELAKHDASCLHYIYKNGYYDLFDNIKKDSGSYYRYVYVFEFEDNNAYIGLSYNPEKRHQDHLSSITSQVKKHLDKTGAKYEFKLLTDKIESKAASKEERRFITKYVDNGWVVLNKNGGGALGSKKGYSYDDCKNKAKEYKFIKDFRNGASGYYSKISKMKWGELTEHLLSHYDYVKTVDYYLEKYPKDVIDILMDTKKNGLEVSKETGLSHSYVCVLRNKLIEFGILKSPNKEDEYLNRPDIKKIIDLIVDGYFGKEITEITNSSLTTIARVRKIYMNHHGISLDSLIVKKHKRIIKPIASKYTEDIILESVEKYKTTKELKENNKPLHRHLSKKKLLKVYYPIKG